MMGQDTSCLCCRLCFHVLYFPGLSESSERDLHYKGMYPLFCEVWNWLSLPWYQVSLWTIGNLSFPRPCQPMGVKKKVTLPVISQTLPALAFISHAELASNKRPLNIIRALEGLSAPYQGLLPLLSLVPVLRPSASAGHDYLLLQLRPWGPWKAKAAVPCVLVDEGERLFPLWYSLLEKTRQACLLVCWCPTKVSLGFS